MAAQELASLLNPGLSTHTPAGGQRVGARGELKPGRSPATHLAAFSNPPATQGSSSGSARAQGHHIFRFAPGLQLSPATPPPAPREGAGPRLQPPLSSVALSLRSSPARSPAGQTGWPALRLGALAGSGEVGAPWPTAAAPLRVKRGRCAREGGERHAHLAGTRLQRHPCILCAVFTEKLTPDSVYFALVGLPSISDMGQLSVIPALEDLRIRWKGQSRDQGCQFRMMLLSYIRLDFDTAEFSLKTAKHGLLELQSTTPSFDKCPAKLSCYSLPTRDHQMIR